MEAPRKSHSPDPRMERTRGSNDGYDLQHLPCAGMLLGSSYVTSFNPYQNPVRGYYFRFKEEKNRTVKSFKPCRFQFARIETIHFRARVCVLDCAAQGLGDCALAYAADLVWRPATGCILIAFSGWKDPGICPDRSSLLCSWGSGDGLPHLTWR